jgi:hypothetical protein
MGKWMSGQGRGDPGDDYDLVLAEKILQTIQRYIQDEGTNPDPSSLRNTLLAVAALLHLQTSGSEANDVHEKFAEAASDQLEAVEEAAKIAQHKN